MSILFDNGEVYTNGENSNGEIGVGHEQGDMYGFMRVLGLEDVKVIKMAERQWSNNTHHKMALDDSGCVWVWGITVMVKLVMVEHKISTNTL